jgi:nickel/cobalt exporter
LIDINLVFSILTLGFGLGLLHALDADHIMAISSLASGQNNGQDSQNKNTWSIGRMVGFCIRWAIGHAVVLLSLAGLFIFAKFELPAVVPLLAEKLIGVLLISLGCWILWSLWRHKITLETHSHGHITHTHLAQPGQQHKNHQPVLVGIVHGLAGSAPVLAIIPALETNNAWLGLAYVSLFSLGVLTTMLVFGCFLGKLQRWISNWGQRIFQISHISIAFTSIAFGSFWLFAAS